jgi:DNA repair protein RecN (Recombination protein N)
MLSRVQISGFSLVRELDLALAPGLTCLTGESGAGKSLLFDAIAFACGGRTHRSLLASGAQSCTVRLTLELEPKLARGLGPPWQAGANVVARRYTLQGRSTAEVNGEAVKVADLLAATARLIEITGQFESATLFNPATHVELLDAFGGDKLAQTRAAYAALYAEYRDLASRLATLRAAEQNRAQEAAYLGAQVEELEQADVRSGERAEVEAKLRLQHHGEAIQTAAETAAAHLTGGDDGASAYDRAAQAQRELQHAAHLLGPAEGLPGDPQGALELLAATLEQLQETAHICHELRASVAFDAEEAALLTERMNELLRLERKYGTMADELPALLAERRRRLDVLTDETQSPEEVAKRLAEAEAELLDCAAELTKLRRAAAQAMQQTTDKFFRQLDFPHCELQVDQAALDAPGPLGLDSIELLITLNPGEPPRPLAQVASGGEASRLLLGLKAALAGKLRFGVMLLDEIEAGLGGKTAQRVAEVLRELATGRQVLAITHLPVVAARAEQHLVVTKRIHGAQTSVSMTLASTEQRRAELARMLGGLGTAEELAVVDQLLGSILK